MSLRKLASINPFTNKVIKEYNFMGLDEIAKRIQKSKQAFDKYKTFDLADRAEKLNRLADIMEKDKQKYGAIMTKEMGKPLSASIGEVVKSANHCRFYAQNLKKYLVPEMLQADATKCYIKYQPFGPLLYIVPFNFPWWLSFKSGAAQLAAGNTLLMRHSHNTPETGLAIESLFEKAGYIPNICQSLLAPHSYTEEIISNPLIQGVTFTGSTAAGRQIASLSGKYLKKCVMELGGNDPFIILNDADINLAVECAIKSRASNAGQVCFSAKRYIIVEEKYEEFKSALKARLEKLILGDPMDSKTDMGPLARTLMDESKQMGYKIVLGGQKIQNTKGNFYPPTIIEADLNCPTAKKEAFGPIFTLLKVKNEQEAIQVANETQYGLGATIISNNIKKAEELAWQIDAGMVFVNEFVKSDSRFPSGGIKESGYGRECANHGIKEFMNAKTPQNDYIELGQKRKGKRLDTEEKLRKKEAREPRDISKKAKTLKGIKAKIYSKERYKEKVQMKKLIRANEQKKVEVKSDEVKEGALPTYLLDRENVNRTKILSNMIKQKRKEKAGKWKVPIQSVKALTEAEMFQVMKTGKRKKNAYKRRINKICFVPETFTRKPPKLERYIRPQSLRFKKANVTHPELKTTFQLPIVGVKVNPQSKLYTGLGVITKGTVIEVNVADLGLVTQGGKVIWSKYAQVMNHPENDGCINAVLLV